MAAAKGNFDLSLYKDIAEIYRVELAPTSVSTAFRPGNGEKVAIKKIYKNELVNDYQKTQAAQEFPLHCSLDHEMIVKGQEWTENDSEYILVMEYMNDADYFKEKIETTLNPIKHEEKIKSYMNDILEALAYLHEKGIVHGDIKLENMLINRSEGEKIPVVKLCDFGLSRILDQKTGKFLMTIPVGSASYMAPEIKSNSYVNEKIDMWALGIVLYKMSVAYKPTQIIGYKYGDGTIPFRRVDWRKRSKELQDLITGLLEIDPEKRLSAKEALAHSWFNNNNSNQTYES
jgi:serine/threonine protein kinase